MDDELALYRDVQAFYSKEANISMDGVYAITMYGTLLAQLNYRCSDFIRHNEKSPYISVEAFVFVLAERTGLEPATPGVTGRYSNQLNYRS